MMMRRARRALLALLWTLGMFVQVLMLPLLNRWFRDERAELFMRGVCYGLWGRGMSRIVGFKVKIDPPSRRLRRTGTLIVCNHLTFIDSFYLPFFINAVPVSRGDIEHWPAVGLLAKLGGLIMVDRNDRKSLGKSVEWMKQYLETGMNVGLYPEGTSTDGRRVWPFMTGVFQAAVDTGCPVLPITVLVTDRQGRSLTGSARSQVMWFTDVEFVPHMFDLLANPGVLVNMRVGEPLRAPADVPPNLARKQLSARVHEIISKNLDEMNAEADAKLAAG